MSKTFVFSFQHPLRKRECIITAEYTGEIANDNGTIKYHVNEDVIEEAIREHLGDNYRYDSQRGSTGNCSALGYLKKQDRHNKGFFVTDNLINVSIEEKELCDE